MEEEISDKAQLLYGILGALKKGEIRDKTTKGSP